MGGRIDHAGAPDSCHSLPQRDDHPIQLAGEDEWVALVVRIDLREAVPVELRRSDACVHLSVLFLPGRDLLRRIPDRGGVSSFPDL